MMSIVRAVISFQLLHLIAGLSVDHCDKLSSSEYKCVLNVSSENSQLSVQCDLGSLEIKNLDSNIGNAFDINEIPSGQRLWDMCMHSHNGTTFRKEPTLTKFKSTWIVGIKRFPDNFFCDGSSQWILISDNRLNDTRQLGFSSTANCHTQCSTRLTWLDVNNNAFEKVFNNSFCGLQGLTVLHLNNNQIKELERDAFINLKSLLSLELKSNSISVLPPGVFRQQISKLEYLSLSNNQLNSQSIMELKIQKQLKWLHLDGNQIDVLANDIFKHMTQLIELHVGDNLIKNLQGSLTNLLELGYLSLPANNISVIQSDDFKNNIHLWWINFSNNPITTIEPDFCANGCDKMFIVEIANASLTTVPKFVFKSTKLYELDLSSNKIDQIDASAFDAFVLNHLINLSGNLLTEITNVFTKCRVQKLYLDHNRLTKLSFTDFSYKLDILSVTHNNIHTIDTSHDIVLGPWWSLKNLNLSHNHLSEIADFSFYHLTELSVLSLDHNNLSHISENLFTNLNSLSQLFLSYNKIKTIEPHAFPSQLQTLHLDNNQLLSFNVWQLDHLVFLKKLSLNGNTWSCDLSERLEEWLLKHSQIVEDICQIVCEQPNGTLHRVSESSHCPETTSINLNDLNSANEINGVVYSNVWAWLLVLCVCIVMCM